MPANLVDQPATAVDDLANAVKSAAVDLTTKVLNGLHDVGHFDPGTSWFRGQYAAAAGIGLVVMALMAVFSVLRAAGGHGSRADLGETLFKYLPLGVFLLVFSPAIGALLTEASDGMTTGLDRWAGGELGDAARKLESLGTVTADRVPGGVFVALLVFLLMVIGAFCVFMGLMVQEIGLPITGVVAAVSWGMFIHPRLRRKALRVPLTWVAILFAKPLLFLMLGAAFAVIDNSKTGESGVPLLAQLFLASVALIVAGVSPFVFLRYSPAVWQDRAERTVESRQSVVGNGDVHVPETRVDNFPVMASAHAIVRAYEKAQQKELPGQRVRPETVVPHDAEKIGE